MVLVAKMTHRFCILQYHVYIYHREVSNIFFRSVEQVGNDLMSAGFHREVSDIFSVCRTGRQRLDERGVSPRGERHFFRSVGLPGATSGKGQRRPEFLRI